VYCSDSIVNGLETAVSYRVMSDDDEDVNGIGGVDRVRKPLLSYQGLSWDYFCDVCVS
jgi:hypothetical protein